jgi:predicted ATPase/DNA-binding SARP family transcriptional activator
MSAVDGTARVRVEVLGPLQLVVNGGAVEVPGPKRRAVLALLALAEGRPVPVDRLVDALWPTEMPDSARQALHTHVSRLRAHLGVAATRLQTRQDGYRLDLDPADLDVTQARGLLVTARTRAQRDPAGALPLLREAHALWRGPVLADLTDVEAIATAVEGCVQLHRDITDALIGCAIDAREAATVVGLAGDMHATDPLREPAVLLLMRALAATGRAPEALRTGRTYRTRLAEETGLDPSPALAQLERDVAAGAAGAAPVAPAGPARPTTRLIGRQAEVAALHRLLAAERLVTLVGPGGVGKTRVALDIAPPGEASTVLLLAPVTDPAAIPHALAAALNLNVVQGDVLTACLAVLGDDPGLLVVDNCEHLLGAVRDTVGTILAACPRLTVLTTSREPLGLAAEHAFRLAPLPLPDAADEGDLAHVASVAVFLDRAARVRPGHRVTPDELRTVADIVRQLDGMPLAIELAARRLSTFSLVDLQARLHRALDLLGDGRASTDTRHRTLRATVEWSYQLLSSDQQRLFRHLAVFADGVDLDGAEHVASGLRLRGDPGIALARLVDASMIEADFAGGSTRYRMLETLRAFGLDRLAAAGETDEAAERMLQWAVELTGWIAVTLKTELEPDADRVLRREVANLRAAWQVARGRGALDEAVALITALFAGIGHRDLIEIRGWAEDLADEFLRKPALAADPRAAGVLGTAAEAAYQRGDYARAEWLARTGLDRATDELGHLYCLYPLSVAELARGAHADVIEHALAAAQLTTWPTENLGLAALATAYSGDLKRARDLNRRALASVVSFSDDAWSSYVQGEIESTAGRRDLAERHYRHAVDRARRAGATFLVGVAMVGLQAELSRAGRVDDALRGYREVIDYFARTGNWTHQWTTIRNLADLLRRLGDTEPAALLDTAADQAPDAPTVTSHSTYGSPPRSAAALIHKTRVGRVNGEPTPSAGPHAGALGRAEVLGTARRAIARHLGS